MTSRGIILNFIKESNFKTILLFFVSIFVVIFIYIILYHIGVIPSIEAITLGIINGSLILGVLLFVTSIYGVLMLYGGMKSEDMGLKASDLLIAVSTGIIIWIVVQVIEGIFGFLNNGTIEIDPSWTTQSPALIGLLIAMLLGIALFEETGFRGFLLIQFKIKLKKSDKNVNLRVLLALVVSQAFFTLIHIPWKVYSQVEPISIFSDLVFSVFVNGLIYGLLYLRTRNLFYVMIIHGLGNAPTSLLRATIQPSILILLLGIILAVIWPVLKSKEKEIPPT